jgi:hypothetical protein
MGYRSEVGLCLSAEGKRNLEQALPELECKNRETAKTVNELLNSGNMREHKESGAVAYHWEWLKWYHDFDDVSFFNSFMETLDDNDYLFIRLGESDDDNEIECSFWSNPFGMCMLRSISFDDATE